jgi:hypothetical protein
MIYIPLSATALFCSAAISLHVFPLSAIKNLDYFLPLMPQAANYKIIISDNVKDISGYWHILGKKCI